MHPSLFQIPLAKNFARLAARVLLAILVRGPFNFNAGAGEAFYLVAGRQWLNGVPPYAGAFDVKPPLLFLLTATSKLFMGASLLTAKALTTAARGLG